MSKNLFITAKDIQKLNGFKTIQAAYNELKQIKDSLGKNENQKLSFNEYCKYQGVEKSEVFETLGIKD